MHWLLFTSWVRKGCASPDFLAMLSNGDLCYAIPAMDMGALS